MRFLRVVVVATGVVAAAVMLVLADQGSHSVSDTLYASALPVVGVAVLTLVAWRLVGRLAP